MTTPTAWLTVARREIISKLTDKTFLWSTFGLVAIIAGIFGVQAFMANRASEYAVVTSSSAAHQMAEQVKTVTEEDHDKTTVALSRSDDDAAAQELVRNGDADVWLHEGNGGWVLSGKTDVPGDLLTSATTAIRDEVMGVNAAAANTSVEALQRGSEVSTALLDVDADRAVMAQVVGFALAMLFYLASFTFGLALANSVVEEKASRIVEIITTKISVRELLAGKVIGNLVLAFAQMALFVIVGLVGLSFTEFDRFVPAISGAVGWFTAFFVVGFGLLATLWAVAGALSSRTEDVQVTSTPLTMITMAILFAALFADGTVKVVLSFVPPFSAIVMPMRVLEGSAPWWQALLALAILVVAAGLVVRVAARLYQRSLLQTQGRLSLRQAWSTPE
ncbi:sodium ABC transporter permease [Knoellia sinensis KCTC 19936]|uniref:Sodium ABC transporter permease n=1 Tax=Knoellia sinensis KCTC 19936 TaxID=1385520 RepID=A0A0A0J2T8_9MICO|nr:ABC transporter permease [Knoellia sinensis]KGN31710.1 sodium ABC transporter permease [Knoellia sinensis KCTC 19936]